MRVRSTLMTFALGAVLACGGDKPSEPVPTNVVGTWTLTSINGSAPPGVVQAANPKIELLSDSYTFNAAGFYSETGMQRTTTGTSVVTEAVIEGGAWVLVSGGVALQPDDAGGYSATVNSTSLTLKFGSLVLVYTK